MGAGACGRTPVVFAATCAEPPSACPDATHGNIAAQAASQKVRTKGRIFLVLSQDVYRKLGKRRSNFTQMPFGVNRVYLPRAIRAPHRLRTKRQQTIGWLSKRLSALSIPACDAMKFVVSFPDKPVQPLLLVAITHRYWKKRHSVKCLDGFS
jgi:hypothetical protein